MTTTAASTAATPAPRADQSTRSLAADMAAAARCESLLEHLGLRIGFRRGLASGRVDITLERIGGERLRALTMDELLTITQLPSEELFAWAGEVTGQAERPPAPPSRR